MIGTFKEFLNENSNNIKYIENVDDDRTTTVAFIGDIKVGSITTKILFDAYSYEFEDVFEEDDFYDLYPDTEIVKIEHIEIDDDYKNSGVGTKLMNRVMETLKADGYNQFYLNASPMGFSGLYTSDLVDFYKKFGFKVLLDQGHNVLMGIVKNN